MQISKTDFGGKLTIDYFSDEDLQKLLQIVKSQGKITDFHVSGTEGAEDQSLQKITEATALEPVEEPVTPQEVAQEAIESEQAVSEVIEDVVVEGAHYAGMQEEVREAGQETEATSQKEEDEGDIYSLRNFNL